MASGWTSFFKNSNTFNSENVKSVNIQNNLRLYIHYDKIKTTHEMICFSKCVSNKDCKAASFDSSASYCYLHKDGFTQKKELKWISYIKEINNFEIQSKNR
jgi:hypothetical protein